MKPLVLTRRSKFNAVRTPYNGVIYDSKREAARALELDILVAAKKLTAWDRQINFPLVVNGIEVCTYRIDFELHWPDGSVSWEEVKGKVTPAARIKMRLWQALNPDKRLEVVR